MRCFFDLGPRDGRRIRHGPGGMNGDITQGYFSLVRRQESIESINAALFPDDIEPVSAETAVWHATDQESGSSSAVRSTLAFRVIQHC